ncbi:hypothetical protein [Flavobacterium sp. UBA4197]|uniref:hypothetical protein n=1 Tax=Flavobacterium sp. UBA4197 TaxID=1946546 RepID=UPI00257FB888|nr:hypothetical protein [Flavobacterium sp. UBA4197]
MKNVTVKDLEIHDLLILNTCVDSYIGRYRKVKDFEELLKLDIASQIFFKIRRKLENSSKNRNTIVFSISEAVIMTDVLAKHATAIMTEVYLKNLILKVSAELHKKLTDIM